MERKKIRKGSMDIIMFLSIMGLIVIGVIMVYSSSYFLFAFESNNPNALLQKEIIFAAVGLVVMLIASKLDVNIFRRLAIPINIITIVMYALLLSPMGVEIRGGLRWVQIGGQTIMPSEFAKYAAIIALAYVLTAKKHEKGTLGYYFLAICPLFYVIATFLQPDMSSAIVIAVAIMAVLFYGGLNLIYIILGTGAGIGLAVLGILLSPFRRARLMVLFDPFLDPTGRGFQVLQSLYAVASGGLAGKGLGNGIQKMLYLPLAYNDYIFSVYAEELGFVGCVILLVILSTLVLRGYKVAANAVNKFSVLLAGGIITQIAVQSIINMYVSVSLFPSTGIPFPIISYGGTSLITTLGALGLVLSISRQEIAKTTPRAYEQVESKKYHSLERRNS